MTIQTRKRVLESLLDRLNPAGHMMRVHHLDGNLFGVSDWNLRETSGFHVRTEGEHLAAGHSYPKSAKFTKAVFGDVAYLIGPL
jgi:hypothetical protein